MKKEISEERLWFVKYWSNYVRKNKNSDWSKQQNILINSMLLNANQDRQLYLKAKFMLERKN